MTYSFFYWEEVLLLCQTSNMEDICDGSGDHVSFVKLVFLD